MHLVAIVIDLHEHDADVSRELGLADDPDDLEAAELLEAKPSPEH